MFCSYGNFKKKSTRIPQISSILNFIFLKVLKENKARVTFIFMMASFYTILYVYTFLIFKWDNFVFLDRVRVFVLVWLFVFVLFKVTHVYKKGLCNTKALFPSSIF